MKLEDKIKQLEEENLMLRREWDRVNKELEQDARVQLARQAHEDCLRELIKLKERLKIA